MAEFRIFVYAAFVAVALLPLAISASVGWRTAIGRRGIWTALVGFAMATIWFVLSSPRSN